MASALVEKIPSWIERLLLPRLSEISGEIKALSIKVESLEKIMNERTGSLEKRIESLEKTMDTRMSLLEDAMKARFEAVNTRMDALEKRIPVIEEIATIKIRLAELEKRVQRSQKD